MIIDLQKQQKNKKVIGKFKDELGGKIIVKFCALRAKAYAYKLDYDTENKKLKEQRSALSKEKSYLKTMLILYLKMKYYQEHNIDLEVIIIKSTQKKLIIILRREAETIRNDSLQVINELNELRKVSGEIKNTLQILRNESQLLRNNTCSDSLMLRNNPEILRRETETIRNDSLQVRNEAHNLIDEAEEIRISSQVLRRESRALRKLWFTDKDFTKKDMVINSLEDAFDTSHLFVGIVVDNDLDMLLFHDVDKTGNDIDTDDEFIERDRLGIDRDKPDSKKKPDTMKDKHDIEIDKPDIETDEPVTEIDEPGKFKRVECISSNGIIYEIQIFQKYKEVLVKVINERLAIFEDMDFDLPKIFDSFDILKHHSEFNRLCKAARMKNTTKPMIKISKIYALNCISDDICRVFKNCPYFKSININLIRELSINDTVTDYYDAVICEKRIVIQALLKEIILVKRMINVNIDKYFFHAWRAR